MANPNSIPSEIAEFQFERWRQRFLRALLILYCVLGLVLYASIFFTSDPAARWLIGAMYLSLVVVTIGRFPYRVKVFFLLAFGELVGLYTLFFFGPRSDASLFLFSSCVFASLLLTRRVDWTILVLNTVVLAGLAVLDWLNVFVSIGFGRLSVTPTEWFTYTIDFLVLGTISIWAIDLLKNEFRSIGDQFSSTVKLLTKERATLEQRVDERAAGLTQKTDQLRTASYIARQTAEARDLLAILNTVVHLVTDQFGYYHAGIYLTNEVGDVLFLQAASSEGGKQMVERGHVVRVNSQGVIGYVASQKRPRIALDVGADAVYFNNPDLPLTRSQIALPLLVREKVLGVLDIQSDRPQAFRSEDIDIFQTIVDQIAVAIDNARLINETQTVLSQLEAISGYRMRQAWADHLKEQKRAFTYTPLGVRAEGGINESVEGQFKTSITLRGQKIGSIVLSKKDQTEWNKLDQDMVNEVANQVALAVDNLRLLEDAQHLAKREQIIGELATRFSQSLDIDSLLQTAAREIGQLPDVSDVSVYIGQMSEQAPPKRRKRSIG